MRRSACCAAAAGAGPEPRGQQPWLTIYPPALCVQVTRWLKRSRDRLPCSSHCWTAICSSSLVCNGAAVVALQNAQSLSVWAEQQVGVRSHNCVAACTRSQPAAWRPTPAAALRQPHRPALGFHAAAHPRHRRVRHQRLPAAVQAALASWQARHDRHQQRAGVWDAMHRHVPPRRDGESAAAGLLAHPLCAVYHQGVPRDEGSSRAAAVGEGCGTRRRCQQAVTQQAGAPSRWPLRATQLS